MEIVNLREKIIEYRETKNKEILGALYVDFLEYIKNMSRKIFNYEYKETDLIIKFIKIINDLDINGATDDEIQGKIIVALKRGKIDIIRKSINDKAKQPYYFEDIKLEPRQESDNYLSIYLKELIENLSEREKKILELSFFEDETDIYISKILDISSVRVGQIKKKALNKLRKEIAI